MNNYALFAESIKDSVSVPDAIRRYAPNPAPQHNRIPCPIHGGHNYNLGFNSKVYHCFVCGEGGDVIRFVQHIFGLNFPAAVEKLNTDFNLGLPIDRRPTLREQRDAQRRHEQIMQQRAAEDAARQAYSEQYWALWGEWIRLDRNKREHEWTSYSDEPDPLYLEALQKLPYQAYLLDTFMATHPYPGRESVVTNNIGRDQYRSGFDRREHIRNGQQAASQ